MTIPHAGEMTYVVFPRFAREMNEVTTWIAETVAMAQDAELMKPETWDFENAERHAPAQRDNPMGLCGQLWGPKACPDCTPEQPCQRVRRLTGA